MDNMEIKKQVLEMLKALMMENSAKKFKPAAVEVEVSKPVDDKEGLAEHLAKASAAKPMDEEESPVEEDAEEVNPEMEDEEDKKKGLRHFLGRA